MSIHDMLWERPEHTMDEDSDWHVAGSIAVLQRGEPVGESAGGTLASRQESTTSTDVIAGVRLHTPVLRPPTPVATRSFIATGRWEGAVSERMDTYFVAEVVDLDNNERATVEFDLAELSPVDIELCEPGALFYWSIGYEIKDSGQRSRSSVIIFRRAGRVAENQP
jgi:hypothetical protein